jgi:hypothetical protein
VARARDRYARVVSFLASFALHYNFTFKQVHRSGMCEIHRAPLPRNEGIMRVAKHFRSGPFLSAVIVLLGGVFVGTTRISSAQLMHSPAAVPAGAHAQPPRPQGHSPRTPYERIFAPGLARMHGSVAGIASKSIPLARPAQTGVPSPNFAGYPSGLLFAACPSADIATGGCNAENLVTGDFNQDGKPDVAYITDHIEDSGEYLAVFVQLGDGQGSLGQPIISGGDSNTSPPSVYIAGQPIVADMNGDGYPDLVEMTSTFNVFDGYERNDVFLYINQKDGTFSAPEEIATAPGESVIPPHNGGGFSSQLLVGDVNGDGRPDLVFVGFLENGSNGEVPYNLLVSTFLANANGTFADPTHSGNATPLYQQLNLPLTTATEQAALADVNGDGHLDLILQLAQYTTPGPSEIVTTTQVFPGHGDGSFADVATGGTLVFSLSGPLTGSFYPVSPDSLLVGDLNKDGALDLVMVLEEGTYSALGNGDGTFQKPVLTALPLTFAFAELADMNGDGFPDLLLFSDFDETICLGAGDGTFSTKCSFALGFGGGSAVADFNGDGKLDVVAGGSGGNYNSFASADSHIIILRGQGDGTLFAPQYLSGDATPSTLPDEFELMAAGNFNGDGYTDVILHDNENPVFRNNSSANQNHLVSAMSDGKGNFKYAYALPFAATANLSYIEPTPADFNGDGLQDLLYVGLDNSLSVALSHGDGTFANPVSVGLPPLQCEVTYSVAGDLNGDGNLDIVAPYPGDASCGGTGSTPSGYFVALGHGDGSFATPVFTAMCNQLYSAALGDFNGDGKLDLVTDDTPYNVPGAFDVAISIGNGDGTFAPAKSIAMNAMVSQVIVGDFNQDGKLDLVLLSAGTQPLETTDYSTAGVLLYPGNGEGSFGASTLIEPGNFFSTGFLEDVNGDGIPDLTLAQTDFDASTASFYGLATLLGTGGGKFAAPVATYLSSVTPIQTADLPVTDYTILLPGNFYADNAPDFVAGTTFGPSLYLGLGGDTLQLSDSAASIVAGGSISFTASITPSMAHRPVPTGQVGFYDGSTLLGQVTLDGGGSASFSTSALAVGSHAITAAYGGDNNSNSVSGATTVSVTALTPAFTLTASPSTLTIAQGHSGTATLTLAANAAFSGLVSFNCGALPANVTCTFSPSSLSLTAGQTSSVALLVNTASQPSSSVRASSLSVGAAGIAAASLLLLGCVPIRRRRRWMAFVLGVAALCAAGGLSGCGSGRSAPTTPVMPVAAMGSATVVLSAADSSGSTSQTASITLVID